MVSLFKKKPKDSGSRAPSREQSLSPEAARKQRGAESCQEQSLTLAAPSPNAAPNVDALGLPIRRTASSPLPADGFDEVLKYGYWPIETERILDLGAVDDLVKACTAQIRKRGLDSPLILSSQALDISADNISSLIRAYLAGPRTFYSDLQLASPHDLGGLVKWALGRVMNVQGKRGLIEAPLYERWRLGERESAYPPRYISTHLLRHLPTETAELLRSVLDLLSSVAAYTTKNGQTPRKLAALFSPFIFGLADDQSFDQTYAAHLRHSHATEHLLLAFIRDQKDTLPVGIPAILETFIKDYPNDLASNLTRPHPRATLVACARVRRYARFHSNDLIASASAWNVPRSPLWSSLFPSQYSLGSSLGSQQSSGPVFTSRYRHLLRITGEDEVDDDLQRHRNVSDRDWSMFKEGGFADTDDSKLKFDLGQTVRPRPDAPRRQTREWSNFDRTGFLGREAYLQNDLQFDDRLLKTVDAWPEHRQELSKSLHKAEKQLPEFPFDITPHEEPPVAVDVNFFEAWADALVSSGWQRDELKETSWVLCQFRARPKDENGAIASGDGRVDERWILFEEIIPEAYLKDLHDGKKQKRRGAAFVHRVRRKKDRPLDLSQSHGALAPPVSSRDYTRKTPSPRGSPAVADTSVFQAGEGQTKMIKLSNDRYPSTILSVAPSRTVSMKTSATRPSGAVVPSEPTIAEQDYIPPVPQTKPSVFAQIRAPRRSADKSLEQRSSSPRFSNMMNKIRRRSSQIGADDLRSIDSSEADARAISEGEVAALGHEEPGDRSWVDVLVQPDVEATTYQSPTSATRPSEDGNGSVTGDIAFDGHDGLAYDEPEESAQEEALDDGSAAFDDAPDDRTTAPPALPAKSANQLAPPSMADRTSEEMDRELRDRYRSGASANVDISRLVSMFGGAKMSDQTARVPTRRP